MKYRFLPLVIPSLLLGCAQFDKGASKVDAACEKYLPFAQYASLIPGIPASIASYVIAGCDTAQGLAKLRADPDSVAWLAKVDAEIRAAIAAMKK